MILQNLHTHTIFSDGKSTAEEMVLAAIAAGCHSLGFSEHSPLPWGPDGWATPEESLPLYQAEIRRLQEKYEGQLEIFIGLEQDLESIPLQRERWDYVIGSVHTLMVGGKPLYVDYSKEDFCQNVREHFGGDYYAFAERYYSRVTDITDRSNFDIVGHFDLLTKYNEGNRIFDEQHPRYLDAAIGAIDLLIKADKIFEINTGAISRGYRVTPYPSPHILKLIKERNGRICITSDSHSADSITCAFDYAYDLARSCGFRETWLLSKKGFIPHAL